MILKSKNNKLLIIIGAIHPETIQPNVLSLNKPALRDILFMPIPNQKIKPQPNIFGIISAKIFL